MTCMTWREVDLTEPIDQSTSSNPGVDICLITITDTFNLTNYFLFTSSIPFRGKKIIRKAPSFTVTKAGVTRTLQLSKTLKRRSKTKT